MSRHTIRVMVPDDTSMMDVDGKLSQRNDIHVIEFEPFVPSERDPDMFESIALVETELSDRELSDVANSLFTQSGQSHPLTTIDIS